MLLTTLLLISITTTTAIEVTDAPIDCTNTLKCTEVHKAQWLAKRRSLLWRLQFYSQFPNRSRYVGDEFCWNSHDVGFLLDDDAIAWPIACTWIGGEEHTGVCSPAPPAPVFGYITEQLWRRTLVKVRTEFGCPKEAVDAAHRVTELYFCRDRCMQAGVSYLTFFFFMIFNLLTILCVFDRHR